MLRFGTARTVPLPETQRSLGKNRIQWSTAKADGHGLTRYTVRCSRWQVRATAMRERHIQHPPAGGFAGRPYVVDSLSSYISITPSGEEMRVAVSFVRHRARQAWRYSNDLMVRCADPRDIQQYGVCFRHQRSSWGNSYKW